MVAGSYVDLRKAASKKAPDNNFAGVSLSLHDTGVTLLTASISNSRAKPPAKPSACQNPELFSWITFAWLIHHPQDISKPPNSLLRPRANLICHLNTANFFPANWWQQVFFPLTEFILLFKVVPSPKIESILFNLLIDGRYILKSLKKLFLQLP